MALDYMTAPKETIETVRKFVDHGERHGGECSFVREELAELIRAVERWDRVFSEKDTMFPYEYTCSVKDNLVEEIAHVYLVLNHLRYVSHTPVDKIQEKMDQKIKEYKFETYDEFFDRTVMPKLVDRNEWEAS